MPNSLLAWTSADFPQLSDVTTACAPSPRPFNLSIFHKPQVLVVGPPTLLPSPSSSQCIPGEVFYLSPGAPSTTPPFIKYEPLASEPPSPSPAAKNPRVPPQVFPASLPSKPRFLPQRGAPPGPPLGRNFLRQSSALPTSSETSLNVPKLVSTYRCYGKPPASPGPTGVGHDPNT